MNIVEIIKVQFHQKDILRNLLTVYLIELSEILNEKIDASYSYFDSYFTDGNRQAYFIKHKEDIIGFVFVNDYCILEENEIAIAEFYIEKEFRNQGFATKATQQIFQLSEKKWEVKTSSKNKIAIAFWRKVIRNSFETKQSENIILSFKY